MVERHMTTPETRTVYQVMTCGPYNNPTPELMKAVAPKLYVSSTRHEQTAMVWCLQHDKGPLLSDDTVCGVHELVRIGVHTLEKVGSCIVSTGGPDHKWWKDQA